MSFMGSRRRIGARGWLCVLALAAVLSAAAGASSTPDSARSELQLELADLLLGDERYWEALAAYERAKVGATPAQTLRASVGLLRSLLYVAEFSRAHREALFLGGLRSPDPEIRSLQADAFWAYGLFDEAGEMYRDILAEHPASRAARHGVARNLAARNRLEEALVEARAAIGAGAARGEFYHTLGSIYRRLHRYPEAGDALEEYVERLPNVRRDRRTEWARSEVLLLRSFGDRVPFEIATDAEGLHTIPFRLEQDKVVVRGRVNGGEVIDLVVDTGAEQMVLSQQTAERMGVPAVATTISAGVGEVGVRGLEIGRVDALEIGSLEVRNLPAIIKNPPLTDLPVRRVRDSISPVALGLSAELDYEIRQLTLARRLPDRPADIELPLRINRLALVRGVVNEEFPRSFVVDTGGEVVSLSIGTVGSIGLTPPRHIPLQVFGTSGWDKDAFLLPGVRLAFSDQIRYDNLAVIVLNLHRPSALLGFHIGGIVGHTFLRNYRVTLDMERALLRLTHL
jgi:Flp pilus assembly protein TadD